MKFALVKFIILCKGSLTVNLVVMPKDGMATGRRIDDRRRTRRSHEGKDTMNDGQARNGTTKSDVGRNIYNTGEHR